MKPSPGLALALLTALSAGVLFGPSAPPPRPAVRGRVVDEHGPVAGALVRFQGTATLTHTDSRGRFHLPRPGETPRVTAWKEGYQIGGTALGAGPLEVRLRPLPGADHEAYAWVDPEAGAQGCARCHAEVYREWSASGHARSATGPHFRGLYEGTSWDGRPGVGWGLLTDYPDGAGVCSSCHAPSLPDGDPALFDLRQVRGVAARGVHCDYCHKIAGTGPAEAVGLTHGRFDLRLLRPRAGQLFLGPLDDVDRGEDGFSPLYRHSRYCASCHEGVVFGVHVYGTYSEWQASPARRAGLHCQNCHMAPTGRLTNLAPGHGGIERDPGTLGNHRFFAGSQADMLRRAVRASTDLRRTGEAVRVEVRITADGAGHRVPTGFIDRHLLLVVEGRGADGQLLPPRQGPLLPASAGDLAGQPGRLFARLLRDEAGHSPAPFWRAEPDPVSDTRLTPGQPEHVVFRFPARLRTLRLRLVYRRFWQEVARAKGWPDHDLTVLDHTVPAP